MLARLCPQDTKPQLLLYGVGTRNFLVVTVGIEPTSVPWKENRNSLSKGTLYPLRYILSLKHI